MGKTRKRFVTARRPAEGEDQHWLGHGIDGQDALLFDLDPYLYAADPIICRIAQQVAHSAPDRAKSEPNERPKAALLLGYDLNPWTVGFLSERFDVALVTEYVDPIVEETADQFDALLVDEEEFFNLEPVFDFILRFECSKGLDPELMSRVQKCAELLICGGVALFPTLASGPSKEHEAGWLEKTLGFREFSKVETERVKLSDLSALPDFGVGDFAKRHRAFYGKEARDLCLKRIYERDFQSVISSPDDELELIIGWR